MHERGCCPAADKHLVGMDRIAVASIVLGAIIPVLIWRLQRFLDRATPAPAALDAAA